MGTLAMGMMALALLLAMIVGGAPTVSAGGWAVGTLDTTPTATAGTTIDIGFTILQHGVTPIDLDKGVGIEIARADGSVDYFPASGDGTVGHYVSTVTFPESEGAYEWTMRMGWFAPQDLGLLEVGAAPGAASESWSSSAWPVLVSAAVALTVVVAGIAVVDVIRRRPARDESWVQPTRSSLIAPDPHSDAMRVGCSPRAHRSSRQR